MSKTPNLDRLNNKGILIRKKEDGNLGVSPWSRVTRKDKLWIKEHKSLLLEELESLGHENFFKRVSSIIGQKMDKVRPRRQKKKNCNCPEEQNEG